MEVPGKRVRHKTDSTTEAAEGGLHILCDPCSTDGHKLPAEGFCIDCQHYLCSICYQYHQRPLPSRHHVLQDKSKMPQEKSKTILKDRNIDICSQHGDKTITHYCKAHTEVVCSTCLALRHTACKGIVDIDSMIENTERNNEFKDVIKKLMDITVQFNDNNCESKENLTTTERYYEHAIADIEELAKLRKNMNAMFDQLENETKAEARQIKNRSAKKLAFVSETCTTATISIQTFISDLEILSQTKQSRLLCIKLLKTKREISILQDCLEKISKTNAAKRYKFEPDENMKAKITSKTPIGRLSDVKSKGTKLIFVKDIKLSQLKISNFTNMAELPDGHLMFVDEMSQSAYILDTVQNKVKCIELPSPAGGITKVNRNEVAVTLPKLKKILFLKVFEISSEENMIRVDGECYAIEYANLRLAVSFRWYLQIMELNGTVLKRVDGEFHWSMKGYKDNYYVAMNKSNNCFYVYHSNDRTIKCLTPEGEIQGKTKEEFSNMTGMCTGHYGTVFVIADGDVYQINSDCTEIIKILEKCKRERYTSIAYNSAEDMLYVGSKTVSYRTDSFNTIKVNTIKVYRLNHE